MVNAATIIGVNENPFIPTIFAFLGQKFRFSIWITTKIDELYRETFTPTGMRMGLVKAAMRKIEELYQWAFELKRAKHQGHWYYTRQSDPAYDMFSATLSGHSFPRQNLGLS